jgi:carbonic anhydrase/acetyltransferase-like protein (isoleucine patch superfamily)
MIRAYNRFVPKIHPKAFVHDCAEVIGQVVIREQASIWPLCVLRGDVGRIVIGPRSNIQDLTVIHTRTGCPAWIGAGVTVGHRVIVHGSRIGNGCLIGMGAIVMEASIGEYSLIGAGALVLSGMRIPAHSLVLGSPAKVVRRLMDKEIRHMEEGKTSYLKEMEIHRKTSYPVFPP